MQPKCAVSTDTPLMPACVVQSRNGESYVPRKYWMHPEFNRYGLAPLLIESLGGVYIDRTGRILIRGVAMMDNFPDDFHHGLVRILVEGKYGYADSKGHIVVPAKYSCAMNFKDESSDVGPLVCVGCHTEKTGEYQSCVGGEWFKTDAQGHLTATKAPD